jgi:hypothetical protein
LHNFPDPRYHSFRIRSASDGLSGVLFFGLTISSAALRAQLTSFPWGNNERLFQKKSDLLEEVEKEN